MKKRYFSFIALSLVFIMFLLATGCGVRINGKDYEFFKSSSNDKNNIFSGIGGEITNTQSITQDKIDGEGLKVSTGAGNIDIDKSNGSNIEVNADKKVRGASEENKKLILENMIISIEKEGKENIIVVKTKDGENFWDWQKDHYKTYQITINFDIKIPDNFKVIDASTGAGNIDIESKAEKLSVSTGAGNIDLRDMNAELDISTGAGNIDIQKLNAKGNCKLSTGAGNVDFEGRVDDIGSFKASTGMGNVEFDVPDSTKMSLEASTGVGNLDGSFIHTSDGDKFHFKGDINGGGPSVSLSTGVGNVSADKK